MRLTHSMMMMFIGSFLIQYFCMSPIMADKFENIRASLGKVYLSIIMGLYMVVLEIMMHDHQYGVLSLRSYALVGVLLIISIYLYRTQKYVTDKQYLEEMVEHHSMAMLTSKRIIEKTDDYNVAKLAKNIILKQEEELKFMKNLLSK